MLIVLGAAEPSVLLGPAEAEDACEAFFCVDCCADISGTPIDDGGGPLGWDVLSPPSQISRVDENGGTGRRMESRGRALIRVRITIRRKKQVAESSKEDRPPVGRLRLRRARLAQRRRGHSICSNCPSRLSRTKDAAQELPFSFLGPSDGPGESLLIPNLDTTV